MMSMLDRQLREDRLLRDAARALVLADYDRVKTDLQERTVGRRVFDRARDGASELLDAARDKAGSNPGVLALLLGAIGLWFARHPLLALLDGSQDEQPITGADEGNPPHHREEDQT